MHVFKWIETQTAGARKHWGGADIKREEGRVLATIEKFSLHLLLPKALEDAGQRRILPLAPDLKNLMAVFQVLLT